MSKVKLWSSLSFLLVFLISFSVQAQEKAATASESKALTPNVAETKAAPEKKTEVKAERKILGWGSFEKGPKPMVTFHARLRFDFALNTSRVAGGGNRAWWVLPNYDDILGPRDIASTNDSLEANMYASQSRFGFAINAIDVDTLKAKVNGKLEIDFLGGDYTSSQWQPLPRMRHAYMALDWGFAEILAGQTWDTFSSLLPKSDDNQVMLWSGNTALRRPQLRVTFKPEVATKTRLFIQAAIARPFDINNADYDGLGNQVETDKNGDGQITAKDEYGRATGEVKAIGDGNNDGEDSGVPQVQWRLALETSIWTKAKWKTALSGHYQRAKYNTLVGSEKHSYSDSWSVVAELEFPIIDQLLLRGEFFYGQMLRDVFGGAGQDLNPETGEEIKAMGGWVEILGKPFKVWNIAAGYGIDQPDEDTLKVSKIASLEAIRFANDRFYLSNYFNLGDGVSMAVIYEMLSTTYRLSKDNQTTLNYKEYKARDHRVNFNFAYSF